MQIMIPEKHGTKKNSKLTGCDVWWYHLQVYCIVFNSNLLYFLTIKFQQTQKDKYWKGDKISGNYGKREKIANEKIETVENVKCNICDLIHPPTI